MKKSRIILIIALILIALIVAIFAFSGNKNKSKTSEFKILTSFYPTYIMAINITQGAENVKVDNMTENLSSCIHDYSLTTQDLKKFEDANVFIENGQGLEDFIEKVKQTYPDINIINSSNNITNTIEENNVVNAHFWTSPDEYIQQVKQITSQLCGYNPENRQLYEKNSDKYIASINQVKVDYPNISAIEGKKVVLLNESFSYLLKNLKVDYTLIQSDHEESTISAEKLKETIEKMKNENISTIIIDKDDNTQNATTIASETGATVIKLDSGINGSNDKDAYINILRGNYEQLMSLIG